MNCYDNDSLLSALGLSEKAVKILFTAFSVFRALRNCFLGLADDYVTTN